MRPARTKRSCLTTPARPTLEQAIAYIEDDELVEVTPRHIRLRKRHLDPHERKRQSRQNVFLTAGHVAHALQFANDPLQFTAGLYCAIERRTPVTL